MTFLTENVNLTPMKEQLIDKLHANLLNLHNDWSRLLEKEALIDDEAFLKKIAVDIQQLDIDATIAIEHSELKEQAEVIHFALSSPWGAPFIGETTLLEAAKNYKAEEKETALKHLLSDFAKYGHKKKVPLFSVLDEIAEEIAQVTDKTSEP